MNDLLDQIRDGAVGDTEPITVTLRRCKILAERAGDRDFAEWVDRELNGYGESQPLPDYRVARGGTVVGHFVGPGGSRASEIPIPPASVPEQIRSLFLEIEHRRPISYYAHLASDSDGNLKSDLPSDALPLLGKIVRGMPSCISAYRVIGVNEVAAMVDSVRNKILTLVLALEARLPPGFLADARSRATDEERKILQHEVRQVLVQGNVQNLNLGPQSNTQVNVTAGDWSGLV